MKALVIACLLITATAWAHPGHDEPTNTEVDIYLEGDYRVIQSNGLPDHSTGQFPNEGNPNTIAAQLYTFRVRVKPVDAAKPVPLRHSVFGVAVNGVPYDPSTAEFWDDDPRSGWNYEAKSGAIDLGLDRNNAHVQPNGAYHYHGIPTGLVEKLGAATKPVLLIGWAADGYPIYYSTQPKYRSSYRLKSGTRPGGPGGQYDGKFTADYEYVKGLGDLDECNGHFGVTPEYPQGIYHYEIIAEFPYIPRYWHGTPDESFQHHGPPPNRGRRPPPPMDE